MIKNLLRLTKKIIKKLLYPILYSFIGYKAFTLIEKMMGYKIEKYSFFKALGYYPNLKNPQSFNEKIVWKKIYDRNPLLPIVSDKYRVREYLKEVLEVKEAEKILIPLLYVTVKPEEIPFDTLPEEYVIKPNHASGCYIIAEDTENQRKYTIIGNGKTNTLSDCKKTRSEIINICKKWLSKPYGFYKHEWAYQKIKRKIVIEKLLRDSEGKIPADYKFSVFHGKCHSITVWYDRFIDLARSRYTPEWEYIDVKEKTKQTGYREKPEKLQDMINIAEVLGKPFDYIRVDLYLVDSHIYFGELTSYTESGRVSFPRSYDLEFGSKWNLIPKYWK